jgi:hypothetical protein
MQNKIPAEAEEFISEGIRRENPPCNNPVVKGDNDTLGQDHATGPSSTTWSPSMGKAEGRRTIDPEHWEDQGQIPNPENR